MSISYFIWKVLNCEIFYLLSRGHILLLCINKLLYLAHLMSDLERVEEFKYLGTTLTDVHGTQYTYHSLEYLLPQHRISYNDVLSLINSTIF